MSAKASQTRRGRHFVPPKPKHPEHNPVLAARPQRRILRDMACRIEGLLIGSLIAGLLAYAAGINTGERSAADCWAALSAENQYQQYGDAEFQKFESQVERQKR